MTMSDNERYFVTDKDKQYLDKNCIMFKVLIVK